MCCWSLFRLTARSERKEVGEGLVGWRRIDSTDRPVLLSARTSVAAQFHVEIQGDSRRGPEASCSARMSQRLATWRSSTPVCIPSQRDFDLSLFACSVLLSDHMNLYKTLVRPHLEFCTPCVVTTLQERLNSVGKISTTFHWHNTGAQRYGIWEEAEKVG